MPLCEYDIDGLLRGDVPDFQRVTWVNGRKEHTCCECGRVLPVGQIQERAVLKFDGEFIEYRTCPACLRLRQNLREAGCYIGNYHGELRRHAEHCHADILDEWEEWRRDRTAFTNHPTLRFEEEASK